MPNKLFSPSQWQRRQSQGKNLPMRWMSKLISRQANLAPDNNRKLIKKVSWIFSQISRHLEFIHRANRFDYIKSKERVVQSIDLHSLCSVLNLNHLHQNIEVEAKKSSFNEKFNENSEEIGFRVCIFIRERHTYRVLCNLLFRRK